jgi:hypothetical protein
MRSDSKERSHITSYDSGYEHSLERFIETRSLVAEVNEVAQPATQSTQDQKIKLARKAS